MDLFKHKYLKYKSKYINSKSKMIGGGRIEILAPVNGVLQYHTQHNSDIYIPAEKNHDIVAPFDTVIKDIVVTEYPGEKVRRSVVPGEDNKLTVSDQTKNGRFEFKLDHDVSFWIEVGKASWITDTIKLEPGVRKGSQLKKGQKIGEILIGSYASVVYPNQNIVINPLNFGSEITAGETVLAHLSELKKIDI